MDFGAAGQDAAPGYRPLGIDEPGLTMRSDPVLFTSNRGEWLILALYCIHTEPVGRTPSEVLVKNLLQMCTWPAEPTGRVAEKRHFGGRSDASCVPFARYCSEPTACAVSADPIFPMSRVSFLNFTFTRAHAYMSTFFFSWRGVRWGPGVDSLLKLHFVPKCNDHILTMDQAAVQRRGCVLCLCSVGWIAL